MALPPNRVESGSICIVENCGVESITMAEKHRPTRPTKAEITFAPSQTHDFNDVVKNRRFDKYGLGSHIICSSMSLYQTESMSVFAVFHDKPTK
jgi:hypothetical protein